MSPTLRDIRPAPAVRLSSRIADQGMVDAIPDRIVPLMVRAPATRLIRPLYVTLPPQLYDTAHSEGHIFAPVHTPPVKPAVIGGFTPHAEWCDPSCPVALPRCNDSRTFQLSLTVSLQENSTRWNLILAAVLGICIPVLNLLLYIQRFFKDRAMTGAIT